MPELPPPVHQIIAAGTHGGKDRVAAVRGVTGAELHEARQPMRLGQPGRAPSSLARLSRGAATSTSRPMRANLSDKKPKQKANNARAAPSL
ncbi:hypothetical protein MRX96_020170 [Rhipicephalus microplus]